MLDEMYTYDVKFDENGKLQVVPRNMYDAPVLFDKVWTMETDTTATEHTGIKFSGDDGFVYYTEESEFGDVWANYILFSTSHPDRIYLLNKDAAVLLDDKIQIGYLGSLPKQNAFLDYELRDVLSTSDLFSWNYYLDFSGEIVGTDDEIHMNELDINLPVALIGTAELEQHIQPYAADIKQKAFNERMNRLASRACDIAALNNLFRNKPLAEKEVVGVEQIVIGEIVNMDISLMGTKSFEMKTDDRNLDVILYTDDPQFYDLHLPATVLFRGIVSGSSIHDWLVFDNCKFEAVLETPQRNQSKDGLDAKLGF